ncbi:hypothetical protein EK21DRAFT_114234 [Setomelanomma holmii]|uniref:F-box domain-containing protein n=1 Tax=Setomelanomma holmii TaxID=210430 RepID=A0A9P4H6C1_9PLEO|nr:hypothetical protein EK21DRAFT_114234 [Setomelanomma holmii]
MSRKMPSKPENPYPWRPRVPGEVADLINSNFNVHDCVAMRGVNKRWREFTNLLMTGLLESKLRCLHVILTEEGLMTLRGILRIESWRDEIDHVGFIDHGLYTLPPLSDPRTSPHGPHFQLWLGHLELHPLSSELIHMTSTVIPNQRLFESRGRALALLTEIFHLLQEPSSIGEISLTPVQPADQIDHVVGLRHMLEAIGFSDHKVEIIDYNFHRLAPPVGLWSTFSARPQQSVVPSDQRKRIQQAGGHGRGS